MKKIGFCTLAALVLLITTMSTSASAADEPAAGTAKPVTTAPPISADAKEHFSAGVSLLQDPEGEKVEDAYREFKTAYDLSNSPKILGNIGFCAMRLERDGEAIEAYSRYIREVTDIDPDERSQIVRDLQTLTVGVVRLSITTNVPGAILIDERVPVRGSHVTNSYGPVNASATNNKLDFGVRPGHHIITAKMSGREDSQWELEAYAGSKEQHAFVLKEPPPPSSNVPNPTEDRRPSYLGPILVTAAGGALLVAGSITGIVALGKTSDISDACPNNTCPRTFDLTSARSSARTFVGITDVFLAVGTLAVLGGLYWTYRVSSSSSSDSRPPAAKTAGLLLLQDWRLAL